MRTAHCLLLVMSQNENSPAKCYSFYIQLRTTVHELLHALGFKHEFRRTDRESYIKLHLENVDSGYASQFNLNAQLDTSERYDISSIMHYTGNVRITQEGFGQNHFHSNRRNSGTRCRLVISSFLFLCFIRKVRNNRMNEVRRNLAFYRR